jgi:hypothetical protein
MAVGEQGMKSDQPRRASPGEQGHIAHDLPHMQQPQHSTTTNTNEQVL